MAANAKILEAQDHCRAAERAMRTSMFRWKADHDSAADEFSRAAQCYRIVKDLVNSKDCYLKASECYKKNNSFFHAARALENAIIVCKETATPEAIYQLALDSASLYQQHGSGDSAASVLDKAAKIIEERNPELAVKLFQQAADASSIYKVSKEYSRRVYETIIQPLWDKVLERHAVQVAPDERVREATPAPEDEVVGSPTIKVVEILDDDEFQEALEPDMTYNTIELNFGFMEDETFSITSLPSNAGDYVTCSPNIRGNIYSGPVITLYYRTVTECPPGTLGSWSRRSLIKGPWVKVLCRKVVWPKPLSICQELGTTSSVPVIRVWEESLAPSPLFIARPSSSPPPAPSHPSSPTLAWYRLAGLYFYQCDTWYRRPLLVPRSVAHTNQAPVLSFRPLKSPTSVYDSPSVWTLQPEILTSAPVTSTTDPRTTSGNMATSTSVAPTARNTEHIDETNQSSKKRNATDADTSINAKRQYSVIKKYDQAVDSLRREIGFHQESGNTGAIGRLTVAIVLVQLARGDAVAAEKAYKEWGSNCEVAEMQTLEQILQAYDEEDRESAKRALASPFIRNMDVEYARLAATVPLPEAMEPAPRAAVRENAAPSYVSPNATSTTTAEVSNEEVEESPYAPVTYTRKSDDENDLC